MFDLRVHTGLNGKPSCGGQLARLSLFASVTVTLLLAGALSGGCAQRIVRVPVSAEDIKRSNEASREGDIALARRDFYAALIKYLEAGRLNPNNEYVQNKLGIAYSQLQYYPEAINAFERSIGLNGKYAYAQNNLGSVYFAMRNLKRAEKHFKRAISLNGEVASFHVNLGTLYFERKNFDKGIAEWRKAMAIDPLAMSQSDALSLSASGDKNSLTEKAYSMARVYASMGDAKNAVESLQEALNAGFTDIEAIQKERDFDPIRQDESFVAFMKTALLLTAKQ